MSAANIEDGTLLCPVCNEPYLHHGEIIVNSRHKEDGDGTRIVVSNNSDFQQWKNSHLPIKEIDVSMRQATNDFFAGRRNDISIKFYCEHCQATYDLQIIQHKGLTLVQWK